jgi:hypothetical protein
MPGESVASPRNDRKKGEAVGRDHQRPITTSAQCQEIELPRDHLQRAPTPKWPRGDSHWLEHRAKKWEPVFGKSDAQTIAMLKQ